MKKDKRILVIEDDSTYAALVERLLSSGGFGVKRVENMASARKLLEHGNFDAVLLDLFLPDSSGIKTFENVMPFIDRVPVIILTGTDDEQLALTLLQKGAQEYLIKQHVTSYMLIHMIRYSIERHRVMERLRESSVRDELTGLYNRRGFNFLSQQQINISKRNKKPLYVMVFDLDGLKRINDTFGHIEGDKVISDFARALKKTLRESDIIGRSGGDEFVALLTESKGPAARKVVSRLNKNLAGMRAAGERGATVSFSSGFAKYEPGKSRSLAEVFKKADKLMYEEKNRKNKVGKLSR